MPSAKRAKADLRRAVRDAVLAMDPALRRAEQGDLAARFAGLPGLDGAGTVMIYASAFADEVDTGSFAGTLLARGQRAVFPVVDRAGQRLRSVAVADPAWDLVRSAGGIPEPRPECPEVDPAAIDWVLVPGVAFDRRGFRLGRGGGYYDRLLAQLRPEVPRWAVALSPQWVDQLPVEAHDQPISGIAVAGRPDVSFSLGRGHGQAGVS